MSKKLQKSISVVTSVATTLSLSGVAMLAPMAALATDIVDGDLIRNPNAEGMAQFDIYIVKIVGDKKFKRLILSPHVFESYEHFDKNGNGNNWDDVIDVDQATMDQYTTSDLVRVDGDTKVYRLHAEEGADTGTKYWLNMTADEFTAVFDADSIYTINSTDVAGYTAGSDITDPNATFPPTGVVSEGTLTVSLAADTPAATVVPENAARVPFTKINLTATGGDVVVDSLTVQRTGLVAQDGAFSSINVVDVDTNETVATDKTLSSSHEATINDDITVESGTTKSIMLVGNMASSLDSYDGEVPTLSLVSMTLKDDATLNATLPIEGNPMTLNSTISIATVTLGTGPSNPSSDNAPKIGQTDVNFTEIKISNTSSNEAVLVEQIKFTQYGSASDSDVENLDLVDSSDNSVIATLANMTDKEAVFNFDTPLEIGKGKNKSFMVRGDTVDGAARTVDMSVEKYTDILVKGKLYGFYVTPTAGSGAASSEPRIDGTAHTIGEGTLKVTQASISASNLAEGGTQQILGAFDMVVKGEPITISQIGWMTHIDLNDPTASSNATTSDITNLTIYDENGSVVAGPMDPTHKWETSDGDDAYGVATTTDAITVPVGTHTYTVKADLSTDFSANDTIQVSVTPGANITAKGDITGKSITATPSTSVSSVTQTVKAGSLYVSLDPSVTTASVVKGTNDYVFAKLVLDTTGSGEAINVTQVQVRVDSTTALTEELSNFRIFDGDTELSVTNDPDSDLTNDANPATSTFSLADTLTIAKGTTKTLTIKANISRDCSNDDKFQVGISGVSNVTATGADTGETIAPSYSVSDGATITIKDTGELTIYDSSATPKAGLITANTDGVTVGVFNVSAKYEDVNIEKIYITAAQVSSKGGWDQVERLYLYDGATQVAAVTPTSSDAANRTVLADMTSSPLVVQAGDSKDITIKVDTAPADRFNDLGPGTAGEGFQLKINAVGDVTAKGASSGTTLAAAQKTVSCTLKAMTVYKSVPTVTLNEDLGTDKISSGTLAAGTESGKSLYKFKVTADAKGDIGLYRVSLWLATSTATVTNLYLYDETEKVATQNEPTQVSITDGGLGWTGIVNFYFTNDGLATSSTNVVPYTIAAGESETFTVKADVECDSSCQSTSKTGSVQIQFLGDSSFPSTYPNGANTLDNENYENSFIWGDYNITLGNSSTTASSSEQWTNGYRVASGGGGKLVATSSAVSFTK